MHPPHAPLTRSSHPRIARPKTKAGRAGLPLSNPCRILPGRNTRPVAVQKNAFRAEGLTFCQPAMRRGICIPAMRHVSLQRQGSRRQDTTCFFCCFRAPKGAYRPFSDAYYRFSDTYSSRKGLRSLAKPPRAANASRRLRDY